MPVSGLFTNAVAIDAGSDHTCMLLVDGSAHCWGDNASGQLGDGTTTRRLTRVGVRSVDNAVAIVAAERYSCALIAGTRSRTGAINPASVRCWGANLFGQLGDGTTANRLTAVPVSGLTSPVAIAAGTDHTCALLADGSVRCWGDNSRGQLADGTLSDSLTPTTVAGGGGSVTARDSAAGNGHTCAVRANGTVSCWGDNGNGQLGDGTTADRLTPVPVSGLTNAVAVAAGDEHTCALLLPNSSVHCWGLNGSGQLGDGTTANRLTSVTVSGLTNAVAIAAGGAHTCSLRANDIVSCWGFNGSGQLGNGTTTNQLTPAPVSPLDNAVAIAAGVAYTCALLADGSARCWGFNNSGQLGDGTTTDRLAPVSVSGLTNAVAIAAGGAHTCALVADGSVRCWGSNFFGQLGDGTTANRLTPVTVSGLTNAVAIATGDFHTCALLADGSARCWGDNSAGQLGDGSTTQRPVPTAVTITFFQRTPGGGVFTVAPLVNIVKIAAGVSHTCAILANGSVRCWGENGFGQLGIGTTADVLRPVSVPSFTLNIDPLVHVRGNTGVATVQIIATCDAGQELHVDVTLTQGAVSGHGVGVGECTGGIERYPVTVPAQGLLEGPADVAAAARILDGGVVVDSQEWTRRVQIQVPIVSAGATLEGRATGVGNGKDTASLRLRGQFTAGNGVLLEQATLTLRALLDEAGGAGELMRGGGGAALLPLTLTARAGGTPTEAIYQTASGVRPVVWAEVKQGDPEAGRMEFSIKVDRGTIPIGPALCAPGSATDGQPLTTHLTTSFVIDDGVNPPLEIAMEEAWRCLDLIRGTNHPQSLRTP